jgi:hypothetical protein
MAMRRAAAYVVLIVLGIALLPALLFMAGLIGVAMLIDWAVATATGTERSMEGVWRL